MYKNRPPLLLWLSLASLLVSGCAGLYFRDADGLPPVPPRHSLAAWPSEEYWIGVIFNGQKIGFTHFAIESGDAASGRYELHSEALLAFHFLGFSKRVTLRSRDRITEDLQLTSFAHEYDLDGQKLKLTGEVDGGHLLIVREAAGSRTEEAIPLEGGVYPASAILLYPTVRGLAVGRRYDYPIYDGQRQEVIRVSQVVEAYQESDLFEGRAYRVATSAGGRSSTLWINDRGEPVLEVAWQGILISTLEDERLAKRYLVEASVSKRDVLLEYSRVPASLSIPDGEAVVSMEIVLHGLPPAYTMPSSRFQECAHDNGAATCRIQAAGGFSAFPMNDSDLRRYLEAGLAVQSDDPRIREATRKIVGDASDRESQIERLVSWIREHIEQEPVEAFTSLEVYERRKAECQGLTWLYTAFARALGIPTRVTNGLVYAQEHEGFLYHTWAESYIDRAWQPVDPTFGQVRADATHIRLVDGERSADLMPLVDIVGNVEIEVMSVQTTP